MTTTAEEDTTSVGFLSSDPLTRAARVFSLAYISVNPTAFELRKDRPKAYETLAKELCKRFKELPSFSPKNVKSEIDKIFQKCGSNAHSKSDELLHYGVHWATLPGLEAEGFATFEEVRTAIESLRMEDPGYRRIARESAQRTAYAKTHLRGNPAPPGQDWVMKCICPFDTEDGRESLECEKCRTWQHQYCYYLSAIDPHYCNDCLPDLDIEDQETPSLNTQTCSYDSISLKDLTIASKNDLDPSEASQKDEDLSIKIHQLQTSEAQLRAKCHTQQKQILAMQRTIELEKSMSVFTTLGSASGLREGPSDKDILKTLDDVHYRIQQIIVMLPKVLQMQSLAQLLAESLKTPGLDAIFHGVSTKEHKNDSNSSIQSSLSKTLNFNDLVMYTIWRVVCDRVFYSDIFQSRGSGDPLSAAVVETIIQRDGPRALRNLQLAACSRLTDERSPWFNETVKRSASDLSTHCLGLLTDLICALNQNNENSLAATASVTDHARVLLEEAFIACISLKGRLSVKASSFEILLPNPGDVLEPDFMHVNSITNMSHQASNKRVVLSIRPAFFCYPEEREMNLSSSQAFCLERLNDCFVQRRRTEGMATKPLASATVVV